MTATLRKSLALNEISDPYLRICNGDLVQSVVRNVFLSVLSYGLAGKKHQEETLDHK